jgi:hypothetical protein
MEKTSWLRTACAAAGLMAAIGLASPAQATLASFQSFTGNVGVSTDGWGSTSNSGQVQAEVPVGSTVLGAWLYAPTFFGGTPTGISLGGTAVAQASFTGLGIPSSACCEIQAYRADVTSIVKSVIEAGPGGIYNFDVTKTGNSGRGTDGVALVVAYSNAALPVATVGILDGNASVTGETTTINFASPLDPSAAGFFAEMRLGIGFSCCDQRSTVTVNGTVITENAGNNDDAAADNRGFNGSLITVGGIGDGFSSLLPGYDDDSERYNLVPQISTGDTSIVVKTSNTSQDDNIFLAVFYVAGIAGVNEPPHGVPTPGALLLFGFAAAAFAGLRRRA